MRLRWQLLWVAVMVTVIVLLTMWQHRRAHAHFADAQHLNEWFGALASGKGLCCSFADGSKVEDVDWDTKEMCDPQRSGCSVVYRVFLKGEWIVVPEAALVKQPNQYGPTVVWPYTDANGATQIRCFMPGAAG